MKIENIPADIKSKSLKEAREEIEAILIRLENQETNPDMSIGDYQRLIKLNKHIGFIDETYESLKNPINAAKRFLGR